jgi:hypothetical protein
MRIFSAVIAALALLSVGCGSASSSSAPAPSIPDAALVFDGTTFQCPEADYRAAFTGTDGTPFVTCVWRCANVNAARRREVIAKAFYGAPSWTSYFIVGLGGDCPADSLAP